MVKKIWNTNIEKMLIKNKNYITLPNTISTSDNNIASSEDIDNSTENFNRFMTTLNIRGNFIIKNTRILWINSKNIWNNIKTNYKISNNNEWNMRIFYFFLNLRIRPHNKLSFTDFFTFYQKRNRILWNIENHKLN